MEFKDTYNLVLNSKTGTKILEWSAMAHPPQLSNNSITRAMLCELQRYSIVIKMRASENGKQHLDFTYEPRDCECIDFFVLSSLTSFLSVLMPLLLCVGVNGQPCMVLQTKYFHLSSWANISVVPHNDIVTEITKEEYHTKKKFSDAFICAHEVAFDSKGKRSCNLSM